MSREKIYHVNSSDSNVWNGVEEPDEKFLMAGKDKEFVIRRMEEKAKLNRPSKLIVYAHDGSIELEEHFKDDPSIKSMNDSLLSD